MAVQLGRRHLHLLKQYEYWITEKSDGYRVMFLALFVKNFPKWKCVYKDNHERTLALLDSCAIETSYNYMKENAYDVLEINLRDGKYTLNKNDVTITKLGESNAKPVKLKRTEGWTFSYVFDRKYMFYLCLEEFVFPTYESMLEKSTNPILQWCVLLDGEIVG
jgi:hypothetical protein